MSFLLENFASELALIKKLKDEGKWDEAADIVRRRLDYIVPCGASEFRKLSPLQVSALIIQNNYSTTYVPLHKAMLVALLTETGDYARMKGSARGGQTWYLTALNLLLELRACGESEEFAHVLPSLDTLLANLEESSIPCATRLALARDCEREGVLLKIIHHIESAIRSEPQSISLKQIAVAMLQRVSQLNDQELIRSGITKAEISNALKRVANPFQPSHGTMKDGPEIF